MRLMLRDSFQNMAAQIDEAIDGEMHEPGIHLLAHALEVAQGYDAGAVRAFAHGCDNNPFAEAMVPMLTIHDHDGAKVLRARLRDVFAHGVDDLCASISGHEAPDAGLKRMLGVATRDPGIVVKRACRRHGAAVYSIAA